MPRDLAKKKAYNKEYYQKNKEAVKTHNKEYDQKNKEDVAQRKAECYRSNKQNITYIIILGSEYYFGHTSMGLEKRQTGHFTSLKRNEGCAGLQKRFDELGEEAFKKIFDIQILGTYDTKEESEEQERYLLSKYVGTAGCLNVHTW